MIKNFLSRYRPRFLRSLAYLLQASEYNVADYLAWFRSVKDFGSVERRKRLVKTPKAIVVLFFLWGLSAAFIGFALWTFLALPVPYDWFFAVLFIFSLPYLLAYGIVVPLFIIEIIVQKPIEYFAIKQARKILRRHKAVKIAIAGSFGKTSMREILKTTLSEGRNIAASPQNYNTPLGICAFVKNLNGKEDILIFEFGEYYPGDVRKLCRLVCPDMGIITGVNEAHLRRFKTLDRAAKTIFELAEYLGGRPVYVNGENELARKYASAGHILYDRNGVGAWSVRERKADLSGTSFILAAGDSELRIESALLGAHQIGPLAAAAHIALRLGLSPAQIRDGIGKTKPFDHRLQKTVDRNGVITLDDSYNGNPDGADAAIKFLASLKNHRRFYVTPGLVEMGSRTEAVHNDIGIKLAEAGIEKVVLIKNSVTPYIEEGLVRGSYKGEILWFDDAIAAFAALPLLTARGDVVLLQNDWPDQYR